jgi:hypothetical protein
MKKRYQELRRLIDALRSTSAEADTANTKYRLALLIRFPLFSERDIEAIFRYPYPRRWRLPTPPWPCSPGVSRRRPPPSTATSSPARPRNPGNSRTSCRAHGETLWLHYAMIPSPYCVGTLPREEPRCRTRNRSIRRTSIPSVPPHGC